MKINKIILLSIFLLAVLTFGAVGASDFDDNMTATDIGINDLTTSDIADEVAVENDESLSEIKDFDMYFDGLPDENDVKYGENVDFTIQFYKRGVDGSIDIYVDNNDFRYDVQGSTGNQVRFHVDDFGQHEVIIEYGGNYPSLRHEFTYNVTDFYINVYPDDDRFLYGYETFLNVETLPGMTGQISITISNRTFELKRLSDDLYEPGITIDSSMLKFGDVITLDYTEGVGDRFWSKSFTYAVDLTSEIVIPYNNWVYNTSQDITFSLPIDAHGMLYVNVDGINVSSGELINGSVAVPLRIMDIGNHIINVVYVDDLGFSITSGDVNVEVLPKVVYPEKISVNGSNLSFSMPQNMSGNVEIYIEDYLADEILTFVNSTEIKNGIGNASIKLAEGDYSLLIRYNLTGAETYEDMIFISVLSADPNWNMAIEVEDEIMKQDSQSLLVVTNAHFSFEDDFILLIDGIAHAYQQSGGYFTIDASDLDYGSHNFTLTFKGDEYFKNTTSAGTFNITPILVKLDSEVDMSYDNSIEITLPVDATGKITVKTNGKTVYAEDVADSAELFDGLLLVEVYLDDLKYGISEFEVEYVGNYAESFKKTLSVNATYIMDVRDEVRYGGDTLEIKLPSEIISGIDVAIDGESLKFNSKDGEFGPYRYVETPQNLSCGKHTISISYAGDSRYPAREISKIIEVKPIIYMCYKDYDGFNGVSLVMPDDAAGNFTLYVNHEIFKSIKADGRVSISIDNLSWGKYNLIAKYDGSDYNVSDLRNDYLLNPKFNVPDKMLYKSEEFLSVDLGDVKGKLEVLSYEFDIEVPLVDGKASISLSDLPVGENELFIMFHHQDDSGETIDVYDESATVNVINPVIAGNANVVYSSATNYKIRIQDANKNPVKSASVTFYINNKKVKTTKTDKNGYATLKITQAPGTYSIKTAYGKVSATKRLTVKHVVKLKSVKVKKSAKKLVLTATLSKVNGKYLKGKTVTFKFNGKTYKAKTNKRGVAKVTVKSGALKKLKVGKTVTYKATYLKDTVKKSAKIKK